MPFHPPPSIRTHSNIMQTPPTLYNVLGVPENATPSHIRLAYRKKAKQEHPDRETGDTEAFQKLGGAYEILIDKNKRRDYDGTLARLRRKLFASPEPPPKPWDDAEDALLMSLVKSRGENWDRAGLPPVENIMSSLVCNCFYIFISVTNLRLLRRATEGPQQMWQHGCVHFSRLKRGPTQLIRKKRRLIRGGRETQIMGRRKQKEKQIRRHRRPQERMQMRGAVPKWNSCGTGCTWSRSTYWFRSSNGDTSKCI